MCWGRVTPPLLLEFSDFAASSKAQCIALSCLCLRRSPPSHHPPRTHPPPFVNQDIIYLRPFANASQTAAKTYSATRHSGCHGEGASRRRNNTHKETHTHTIETHSPSPTQIAGRVLYFEKKKKTTATQTKVTATDPPQRPLSVLSSTCLLPCCVCDRADRHGLSSTTATVHSDAATLRESR